MEFPREYFEDEVREGFYVPCMMKRAWAAQLEVLQQVDAVCKKYDIAYFADWGTLLGAVRHGGFIPWDDDMDICMKRPDYKRFLEVVSKELPDFHILNIYNDPEYDQLLTHISNGNTIHTDREWLDRYHEFPYVAGLDIFPLDFIAPGQEENEKQMETLGLLAAITKTIDAKTTQYGRYEAYFKKAEKMAGCRFQEGRPLRQQVYMQIAEVCGWYKEEESDFITSMDLWKNGGSYKFPKEYYQKQLYLPFEHTTIGVPVGYDQILKAKYGNYMQLVKKSDYHEYPFFQRQEVLWKEKCGVEFPYYSYKIEDALRNPKTYRKNWKERAKDFLSILKEANGEIGKALEGGQTAIAVQLLPSCQDLAIQLGEILEKALGEGCSQVKPLEKYCEALYSLYEKIGGEESESSPSISMGSGTETDSNLAVLQASLEEAETLIEQTPYKKTILFIVSQTRMWEGMESLYYQEAAKEDQDCYLMPIPYFTRNWDGSVKEEFYEGESFRELPTLDYKEMNLEALHPDAIYIQTPYDIYNRSISIHPDYYATNLKAQTNCLIYLPYFKTDEIDAVNERAVMNMRYYCTAPGVVCADLVLLPTEEKRARYIQTLTEWAGEESKTIWEEKIKVREDLGDKHSQDRREVLGQAADTGKKTLLCVFGAGNTFIRKDDLPEKLEQVKASLEQSKDRLRVLWMVEDKNQANPEALAQIKENFAESPWASEVSDLEMEKLLPDIDACYGDGGHIMHLCSDRGLPCMVQYYKG